MFCFVGNGGPDYVVLVACNLFEFLRKAEEGFVVSHVIGSNGDPWIFGSVFKLCFVIPNFSLDVLCFAPLTWMKL